jgi:hypothetical protein
MILQRKKAITEKSSILTEEESDKTSGEEETEYKVKNEVSNENEVKNV